MLRKDGAPVLQAHVRSWHKADISGHGFLQRIRPANDPKRTWARPCRAVTVFSRCCENFGPVLFVIADAAALVVDLCNKRLFGNRLSRSGLREVIVYREDSSSG